MIRQRPSAISKHVESFINFSELAGGLDSLRNLIRSGVFDSKRTQYVFISVSVIGIRGVEQSESVATVAENPGMVILLDPTALIEDASVVADRAGLLAVGVDTLVEASDGVLSAIRSPNAVSIQPHNDNFENTDSVTPAASAAGSAAPHVSEAGCSDITATRNDRFAIGQTLAATLDTLATDSMTCLAGTERSPVTARLSTDESGRARDGFKTVADDVTAAGETHDIEAPGHPAVATNRRAARRRTGAFSSLIETCQKLSICGESTQQRREISDNSDIRRVTERRESAVELLTTGGPVRTRLRWGLDTATDNRFAAVFTRRLYYPAHFDNTVEGFRTFTEVPQRATVTTADAATERSGAAVARAEQY